MLNRLGLTVNFPVVSHQKNLIIKERKLLEPVLFIIIFLIVLGVGGYFFLMVYYPEWVGITGPETKKELEAEALAQERREQSRPPQPEKKGGV